jgi:hypothetical protein
LLLAIKLEDETGLSLAITCLFASSHKATLERLRFARAGLRSHMERTVPVSARLAAWRTKAVDLRGVIPGAALPLPNACLEQVAITLADSQRTEVLAKGTLGESDGLRAVEISSLCGVLSSAAAIALGEPGRQNEELLPLPRSALA